MLKRDVSVRRICRLLPDWRLLESHSQLADNGAVSWRGLQRFKIGNSRRNCQQT